LLSFDDVSSLTGIFLPRDAAVVVMVIVLVSWLVCSVPGRKSHASTIKCEFRINDLNKYDEEYIR